METLENIDKENIRKLIEDGWIKENIHPSGELFIYNYTEKAMYEKFYTKEILQCRGLIADKEGNIIARPFPKFFNLHEHDEVPAENFEVFEKIDGSLGILYFYNNKPFIATRGSFTSEQADVANELLHSVYRGSIKLLDKDLTYLFEIIYPENRIVVNYGSARSLTLLGVIRTKTGEEISLSSFEHLEFPVINKYNDWNSIDQLMQLNRYNEEGFVLRFHSGLRVKIKFPDYVKLHSIITGVTSRRIWEVLKEGKSFCEFADNIPDELFDWIKKTEDSLKAEYKKIEDKCKLDFENIIKPYTPHAIDYIDGKYYHFAIDRKEIALEIIKHNNTTILFAMLDNKDYSKTIWKILEPSSAERPEIANLSFFNKGYPRTDENN